MTELRCNYCNWVGQEPSPAEYSTQEAYEEAYADFRDSHNNPERNICPTQEAKTT